MEASPRFFIAALRLMRIAPLLLPGALACAPFTAVAADAAPAPGRPDIIIILADDLGWGELGCFGQEKIKTPNLDRMAAEGERWTRFYCAAPTCAPSRCALLTGRHCGGTDVRDLLRCVQFVNARAGRPILAENDTDLEGLKGDHPMREKTLTLHAALAQAGYDTAAFGKWGLGEYGTDGAPDKHGVGTFYGYTDHRMCHTFYPPFLWKNGRKDVINTPGIPGHDQLARGPVDDSRYVGQVHASERIRDEMLAYLDRRAAAKDGKPFFLYYAPCEPHVALQPPREWVEKYPKDWDTKPYLGDRGYLPHSRPRAAYAATISYLDDNVGRLMKKLKELGRDENTLVIFTSDNGTTHDVGGVDHKFFNSTRELSGLKGDDGEGGIRVPTLMRWPARIPAGRTVSQPGYSPDLMPTVCALAGAHAGETTGENLAPVLLGEKPGLESRRPMVWAGGAYGGQISVLFDDDIKVTRRRLFARPGSRAPKPAGWEVYDLSRDTSEKHNLAAGRPDAIARAKAVLDKEYAPHPDFATLDYAAPEPAPKP